MKFSLVTVGLIAGGTLAALILGLTFGGPIVLGERVDPGNVALLVNNYGTARGASGATLIEGGRVRYNPFTQSMYEYPTYFKTYSFDGDNAVKFSMRGVPVVMPLGVTYRFNHEPVDQSNPQYTYINQLFANYRVSPDAFNNTTFATAIRDCSTASGVSPTELFADTPKFLNNLESCLAEKFPELEIAQVSQLSQPIVPENIQTAVNASFEAQQKAQNAKYAQEQAVAEAAANKAKAEGEAAVKRINADAEAYSNLTISNSLTDRLVELRRIEKWSGQYSTTVQAPNVQLAPTGQVSPTPVQ